MAKQCADPTNMSVTLSRGRRPGVRTHSVSGLTSPRPQFPCSFHPQLQTSPASLRQRQCSDPARAFLTPVMVTPPVPPPSVKHYHSQFIKEGLKLKVKQKIKDESLSYGSDDGDSKIEGVSFNYFLISGHFSIFRT